MVGPNFLAELFHVGSQSSAVICDGQIRSPQNGLKVKIADYLSLVQFGSLRKVQDFCWFLMVFGQFLDRSNINFLFALTPRNSGLMELHLSILTVFSFIDIQQLIPSFISMIGNKMSFGSAEQMDKIQISCL